MMGIKCVEIFRGANKRCDRGINVSAIPGNFGGVGPGDEPALRTRLPRPRRDVIRVEQIGEALVERFYSPARTDGAEICSKNHVTCARCHLVGLASGIGLDDLVLGRQQRRAPARSRRAPPQRH